MGQVFGGAIRGGGGWGVLTSLKRASWKAATWGQGEKDQKCSWLWGGTRQA